MKNILKQKPDEEQYGRTKYILDYVNDSDVKGKKILNIGCGFGWFEYHMVQKDCAHIWGTEVREEDLLTARKGFQNEKVTFRLGNAIKLPFEEDIFDTVVSWDVIEHIPPNTERQMLSEISRVLKPGGTFYLSTPYKSFFGTVLDPAWWLIKHRHYSKKNMREIVESSESLKIVEIIVRGGGMDDIKFT